MVARADEAALPNREGGLVHNAPGDEAGELRQPVQLGPQPGQQGGGLLGQVVLEQGQPVQARGQGHQVPGPGGAVDDAGDQTLQVRDLPQHLDQLLPLHSVVHQPAHRLQPAGDGHRVQQRALQPAAEEPAAHGGLGLVQHPEQGALFLLAPEGFGELQVPPGHRVQLQKATGGVVSEGPQIG